MAVGYLSHTTHNGSGGTLLCSGLPALQEGQSYLIMASGFNASGTNPMSCNNGAVKVISGQGSTGSGRNTHMASWTHDATVTSFTITFGSTTGSTMAIVYVVSGTGSAVSSNVRGAVQIGTVATGVSFPTFTDVVYSGNGSSDSGGKTFNLFSASKIVGVGASNSGWTNKADSTSGTGTDYVSAVADGVLAWARFAPPWAATKSATTDTGYGYMAVVMWPGPGFGPNINRDGVAAANIASVDGVPAANIASVDGVSA